MELLKRVSAVYLLGVAAVIAVQMIISPFYRNVVDVGDIWHVMNWFMAASIIITLAARFHDKAQVDREGGEGISRRYLETYAAVTVGALLALLFFWNWGNEFIARGGEASDLNGLVWTFVNPLFVIVTGLTGCRLLSNR